MSIEEPSPRELARRSNNTSIKSRLSYISAPLAQSFDEKQSRNRHSLSLGGIRKRVSTTSIILGALTSPQASTAKLTSLQRKSAERKSNRYSLGSLELDSETTQRPMMRTFKRASVQCDRPKVSFAKKC